MPQLGDPDPPPAQCGALIERPRGATAGDRPIQRRGGEVVAVAKTAGVVEIRARSVIDPGRAVAPAAPPGLER
eukprot:6500176-Alexandrium_andersonii.AAC.1